MCLAVCVRFLFTINVTFVVIIMACGTYIGSVQISTLFVPPCTVIVIKIIIKKYK